jgi:hypothetical protein
MAPIAVQRRNRAPERAIPPPGARFGAGATFSRANPPPCDAIGASAARLRRPAARPARRPVARPPVVHGGGLAGQRHGPRQPPTDSPGSFASDSSRMDVRIRCRSARNAGVSCTSMVRGRGSVIATSSLSRPGWFVITTTRSEM